MKKMMKSMVCLALAAALVLSLAACGCGYANSPEGVVKRLVNAEKRYDYVTQAEYMEEPGEYIEELADEKINGPESYWNYMFEETDAIEDTLGEKWAKEYLKVMTELTNKEADKVKVEIDDIEEDGDEAWVEFTISSPELDVDNEDIFEEAGIDAEDFYNGDLDEKEAEAFVKAYKKIGLEAINDADMEESELKWKVVKVDGKWKYAKDQSEE